jgi:hypothetical protein
MRREESTTREVWPGMPEGDWLNADRYIKRCLQVMRLPGWEFELQREPVARTDKDNGDLAEVAIPTGRRFGRIFLDPRWATLQEKERRETIAHELCHAFLDELFIAAMDVIRRLTTAAHADSLEIPLRMMAERMIEDVSLAFADILPQYPASATASDAATKRRRRKQKAKS